MPDVLRQEDTAFSASPSDLSLSWTQVAFCGRLRVEESSEARHLEFTLKAYPQQALSVPAAAASASSLLAFIFFQPFQRVMTQKFLSLLACADLSKYCHSA